MSGGEDTRDVVKRALLELRALKARVAELEAERAVRVEPIAIVGMACRFPGDVYDADAYWQMLLAGTDAVTEVPKDRFDIDAFYDPDPLAPGKTYSRWGGFVGQVDGFDRKFFGIAPREARSLDPQQRLLLECSWEALERAGQAPADLRNTRTGVFIGISSRDYSDIMWNVQDAAMIDAYVGTGNVASVAAGRISYVLGLQGPSLAVDTSCSSSLVAVHLACQSLRAGECDLALAAGVNLVLTPGGIVYFSKLRALSPDGHCKTFDARADGYVRGEGCGAVALKPLSRARADGDPIVAVICGSAVNHDGPSSGLTAPNGPAQQAVIRAALAMGGIAPREVGYVEAHGTGTPLGDPIEVQALAAVFGQERSPAEPVVIGSVKTNFGHTEAAAGIASLIKAALVVQHGEIPPSLHFRQPSPYIPWERLPVTVASTRQPWPAYARRRVAGVSSFGFSGTNAHVVLESAPSPAETASRAADSPRSLAAPPPYVLTLSARSASALRQLAASYGSFLDRPDVTEAIADVTYTAAVRRSHLDHRLSVIGDSASAMRKTLDSFLAGRAQPDWVAGDAIRGAAPPVVFLFPGQGGQWWGMGQELLASEPAFRDVIERCEAAMTPWLTMPLGRLLRDRDGVKPLDNDVSAIQPAIFAIEVALAALWRSWGVEPAAVVGHSLGEVAAAVVAGALDLEDGARVACVRSRIVQRARGRGRMVVAELTEAEAHDILSADPRLAVAAVNGPRTTILAGDAEALDAVVAALQERDVFTRAVKVDYASHSPQMDPLLASIRDGLADLKPRRADLPLHSTVTGAPLVGSEMDAGYWADNLRAMVRFWPVVSTLAAVNRTVFLEVSPHPVLTSAVGEGLRTLDRPGVVLGSLRREEPERPALLRTLGAAHVHGVSVDWKRLHPSGGNVLALPAYPWQRERCWVETASDAFPSRSAARVGTVAAAREEPAIESVAEPTAQSDSPEARLEAYVQDRVARILLVPPGTQLDPTLPLSAHGLDSLMAAELRHWIQRDLGLKLPVADARGRTIADVVAYLRAAVADTADVPRVAAHVPASATHSTIEPAAPTAREPAADAAKPSVFRMTPNPRAALRLFCVPDVGGTADDFAGWPERLGETIQVCPIERPGRGARAAEPWLTRVSALRDRFATELAPWLDRPFAIYGRGLGGLIAYEIARGLRAKHRIEPTALIIAHSRAPQIIDLTPPVHTRPEAELLAHVRQLRCAADVDERHLPALRADLALGESYVHATEAPLACPIVVLCDGDASESAVARWAELTSGPFVTTPVPARADSGAVLHGALLAAVAQHLGAADPVLDRPVALEQA